MPGVGHIYSRRFRLNDNSDHILQENPVDKCLRPLLALLGPWEKLTFSRLFHRHPVPEGDSSISVGTSQLSFPFSQTLVSLSYTTWTLPWLHILLLCYIVIRKDHSHWSVVNMSIKRVPLNETWDSGMRGSSTKWSRVVTKEVVNKRKGRTQVFKKKEGKE